MAQAAHAGEVPDPGLAARIWGVLFSPRPTYEAVAARPKALGVLAVTLIVTAAAQFAVMTSEAGQRAMSAQVQQQVRQARAQGQEIPPQQVQQMETISRLIGYVAPAATLVFGPLFVALVALIAGWLCNALLGDEASFRQHFAVCAHSGVVSTVAGLFSMALMYVQGTMESPTRLAVFFPMLPEEGFVTYLLAAFDLVWIWWIVNLAIGLAVLHRRRTGGIAATLLAAYGAFAAIVAAIRAM